MRLCLVHLAIQGGKKEPIKNNIMNLYLLVKLLDVFIQKKYHNKKEVNQVTLKIFVMALIFDAVTYQLLNLLTSL